MSYDDIINTQWPPEKIRDTMSLSQRAKIFLPFAALTGYEKALEEILEEEIDSFENKPGNIKFDDIPDSIF